MTFFAFSANIGIMKEQDITKIAELMKKSGKSKGDLAESWGRDNSAATAFFKGTRDLYMDELDKTADLLGMSTTELVSTMRGETAESSHDEIFSLAITRAQEAVELRKVKLSKLEFAQFSFILYKHGLSEKRTSGQAVLTLATAAVLLDTMHKQAS